VVHFYKTSTLRRSSWTAPALADQGETGVPAELVLRNVKSP
jgi:hypothetical protein